jgi:hypothetical protein
MDRARTRGHCGIRAGGAHAGGVVTGARGFEGGERGFEGGERVVVVSGCLTHLDTQGWSHLCEFVRIARASRGASGSWS